MKHGAPDRESWLRGVMAVAAMVALAFAVIVPPGFMPASASGGTGLAVVICTGHGPLQVSAADERRAPPQKSKAGVACPFAAAAAAAPPILAAFRGPQTFPAKTPAIAGDQSSGRGLAAPPPPAIGPPRSV